MHGRACKQHIFRSYNTSTLKAMRFDDEILSHVSVKQKTKRLWGFKFRSQLLVVQSSDIVAVKGLKPDSTWCWLPVFCIAGNATVLPAPVLTHCTLKPWKCKSMLAHTDWNDLMLPNFVLYIYKSLDRKQPDCTDKHVDKHTDWNDPMPLHGYPCRLSWRDLARTGTDETGLHKHGHCQWLKPPDVGYPAAWLTCKSPVVSNWILTSCQWHRSPRDKYCRKSRDWKLSGHGSTMAYLPVSYSRLVCIRLPQKNWWKRVVGVKKRCLASEPSEILHPPRLWRLSRRRLWDWLGTAALSLHGLSVAITCIDPPPPPPPHSKLIIYIIIFYFFIFFGGGGGYFSNSLWAFFVFVLFVYFYNSLDFFFLYFFLLFLFFFFFFPFILISVLLCLSVDSMLALLSHEHDLSQYVDPVSTLTLQVHSHHHYYLPTDNKANVWHWTWELHIVTEHHSLL